jgi:LmbE family N-acetylglucosaminyl deacetylase
MRPPILLGFPDGRLANDVDDQGRLFHLTARVQAELQRLRPDALITWGPDGGTGHPDHRLVSSIVTQLVRAGGPGVPERLFYGSIPGDGFCAMNPARGEPPFLIPQAKYFSTRVAFSPADFEASVRSMACHKTQYSDDVVQRVSASMRATSKGEWPLAPFVPMAANERSVRKIEAAMPRESGHRWVNGRCISTPRPQNARRGPRPAMYCAVSPARA